MTQLVAKKASLRQITNVEKERIAKKVAQLTNKAKSLRDLFGQLRSGPTIRGKDGGKILSRAKPAAAPRPHIDSDISEARRRHSARTRQVS